MLSTKALHSRLEFKVFVINQIFDTLSSGDITRSQDRVNKTRSCNFMCFRVVCALHARKEINGVSIALGCSYIIYIHITLINFSVYRYLQNRTMIGAKKTSYTLSTNFKTAIGTNFTNTNMPSHKKRFVIVLVMGIPITIWITCVRIWMLIVLVSVTFLFVASRYTGAKRSYFTDCAAKFLQT